MVPACSYGDTMSSSPAVDQAPSSPTLRTTEQQTGQSPSTPKISKPQPALQVALPSPGTSAQNSISEATLTPPPRSPGPYSSTPIHHQPPDGTSSDKSSETAVGARGGVGANGSALSRKESYKAQRQHYRREKKRAASALLHSIEDPAVVLLADWLKVRGSLKSWTKLWCVLKPGLLLLYKSSKAKSSQWVGTVLLSSCQVIERPSKKDGFCFKLYHPLEQSIWAPRGPHNETIGAVVQPLPTAHLIFRAPSRAAGHCWLDGLELALQASDAMLRCRGRGTSAVGSEGPPAQPQHISNEELEKHFHDHELDGTDSDSDGSAAEPGARVGSQQKVQVLQMLDANYEMHDDEESLLNEGACVEEITEENKSLLWFLVKQVRPGMDLSKVVLPTFILEPRSFLDKLSDTYYHADYLAQAVQTDDPFERFKTVLRWYLSGFYKKPKGLKKPYNPVLGEVFRCYFKHPDRGARTFFIAEQVSHHPPISAFYVSNREEGFIIEGSLLAKSKFYGNSTSALMEGCARVCLLPHREVYMTNAPYAHCKGLLLGTLVMEYGGKVSIRCAETGYSAEIEFKLASLLSGPDQANLVSGRVRKGKDTVAVVEGRWDGRIDIKDKRPGGVDEVLVDCAQLRQRRLKRYLVRRELQGEFESARIWAGVSRAISLENQTLATEEKTRIEEAQRERARSTTAIEPRLFTKDQAAIAPEGMVDQGYRYKHLNMRQWDPSQEILEYEEEFVIRSVSAVGAPPTPATHLEPTISTASLPRPRDHSDSESGADDIARRSKLNGQNVKRSLKAIDESLRQQSQAIKQLSERVDALSRHRCAAPDVSTSVYMKAIFVLALAMVIHAAYTKII